jgi:hypothetical protein
MREIINRNVLINGVCRYCGIKWANGKHISISNEKIEAIIKHRIAEHPKQTQRQFCEEWQICQDTYSRYARLRLKHPRDREKVKRIANNLGWDYDESGNLFKAVVK